MTGIIGSIYSSTYWYLNSVNPWKSLETDIAFLPNDHENEDDFSNQIEVINKHFNPALDILLIEAPKNTPFFEKRKERFLAKCPQVTLVAGWANAQTFEKASYLKAFSQASKILRNPESKKNQAYQNAKALLQSRFPRVRTDDELGKKAQQWIESDVQKKLLFSCLVSYHSSLIDKILKCQRKGFRVFVDVGLMHVNKEIAVQNGYVNFLPHIDRLQTVFSNKRVTYFNPPRLEEKPKLECEDGWLLV